MTEYIGSGPTENMHFKPWEGQLYRSKGLDGVRLLIVGEALYSGDATEPVRPKLSEVNTTEEYVIDLAINGPKPHRPFWTKVTKLLLNRSNGEPVEKTERADPWNRVAFYNYLQWWMPAGRTKPTPAMWQDGREPFLQVVRNLTPDLILILGLRLGDNIPTVDVATKVIPHPSSRVFTYPMACIKVHTAISTARSSLRR